MVGKEKITQLSYHTNGRTFAAQFSFDDVTLDDLFSAFKGLMVSTGFAEETIDAYIMDLADELKDIYGLSDPTDQELLN